MIVANVALRMDYRVNWFSQLSVSVHLFQYLSEFRESEQHMELSLGTSSGVIQYASARRAGNVIDQDVQGAWIKSCALPFDAHCFGNSGSEAGDGKLYKIIHIDIPYSSFARQANFDSHPSSSGDLSPSEETKFLH